MTPHQAKYYAHDLTRRAVSGIDRLSMSLFDAAVDLNPHQIEAALFALESPLSKGVILADEVGLGKTIEAGIIICQYWAERRRRILVLSPASIRKQWALELRIAPRPKPNLWTNHCEEAGVAEGCYEMERAAGP